MSLWHELVYLSKFFLIFFNVIMCFQFKIEKKKYNDPFGWQSGFYLFSKFSELNQYAIGKFGTSIF